MQNSVHVTPTNDLKPHFTTSDYCPCKPRVELVEGGGKLIVHNAWDGREFHENNTCDECGVHLGYGHLSNFHKG